jgi:hypothetical protein
MSNAIFELPATVLTVRFMIQIEMIQKCQTTSDYTQLLEWIRLNGPCLGRIQGIGQIVNQTIKMEFIEVVFNRNNMLSPVEVSIYDIPCVNGEFLYENRYNCKIARINSLTFKAMHKRNAADGRRTGFC